MSSGPRLEGTWDLIHEEGCFKLVVIGHCDMFARECTGEQGSHSEVCFFSLLGSQAWDGEANSWSRENRSWKSPIANVVQHVRVHSSTLTCSAHSWAKPHRSYNLASTCSIALPPLPVTAQDQVNQASRNNEVRPCGRWVAIGHHFQNRTGAAPPFRRFAQSQLLRYTTLCLLWLDLYLFSALNTAAVRLNHIQN